MINNYLLLNGQFSNKIMEEKLSKIHQQLTALDSDCFIGFTIHYAISNCKNQHDFEKLVFELKDYLSDSPKKFKNLMGSELYKFIKNYQ